MAAAAKIAADKKAEKRIEKVTRELAAMNLGIKEKKQELKALQASLVEKGCGCTKKYVCVSVALFLCCVVVRCKANGCGRRKENKACGDG